MTSATVYFCDGEDEIASVYINSDGGPDMTLGKFLKRFLTKTRICQVSDAPTVRRYNTALKAAINSPVKNTMENKRIYANGAGCLGASFVANIKKHIGDVYLGVKHNVDYKYYVSIYWVEMTLDYEIQLEIIGENKMLFKGHISEFDPMSQLQ